MSNKPKANRHKKTSTHGGDLGRIICGIFEDSDGSVSSHVGDQRELGWDYKDYCLHVANMLRTFAKMDSVPIEVVWDCVVSLGQRLEECDPVGSKTMH